MIFFLPRANDICFLGCLRSLSEEKVKIINGLYKWKSKQIFFSNHSRYLINKRKFPNPAMKEKRFIKSLIKLGIENKKKGKLFYLPTSDTNMMIAIKNWNYIKKYYHILGFKNFSKPNDFVFNKYKMYKILKQKKILTPKTMKFNLINLKKMLKKYKEVIIKPNVKDYSQTFYSNNKSKALLIKNFENYKEIINKNKKILKDLIIQEYYVVKNLKYEIPIYIYADKNHNVVFSVCGLKHLIHPNKYGSAAILGVCENKKLENLSRKIVKNLKWRGPLMIEFIYNRKKKQWGVIEINGRPWLMIDFFRRLGFSFIKILINDILGVDIYSLLKNYSKKKLNSIKNKSLHLDLSLITDYIQSTNYQEKNISKIKNILKSSKNISISSYDQYDLAPFKFEQKYLKKKLNNTDIISLLGIKNFKLHN